MVWSELVLVWSVLGLSLVWSEPGLVWACSGLVSSGSEPGVVWARSGLVRSGLSLVWSALFSSGSEPGVVCSVCSVLVWSGLGVRPLRGSPPCSSFWPRTAWRISFILIYFLSACMSVFSFLSLNTHCSLLHTDKSNECTGECVICTIKTLIKVYLWLHVDSLTHTKEKKMNLFSLHSFLKLLLPPVKGLWVYLPSTCGQELTTAFSHILCPWLCWWTL